MGRVRGSKGSAAAEVPLLIVGSVLLLAVMLAFFQMEYRRRRRKQYHPSLQSARSEAGVLTQLARRKDDLHRYISTLRAQLDAREQQLRLHDELETIVTARVETSRQDDKEWRAIMKAGRKMHGKQWDTSDADGESLRELMETHKDELLEYKRSMERNTARGDRSARRDRTSRSTPRRTPRAPEQEPVATSIPTPRAVPPQWQSTRRVASSVRPVDGLLRLQAQTAASDDDEVTGAADVTIPPLDFTKLRNVSTASSAVTHVTAEPENFETKFHRQTRLARIFGRKK